METRRLAQSQEAALTTHPTLEWGRCHRVSVAVLFTGVKSAFRSVLTEEAVGLLLQSPIRCAATERLITHGEPYVIKTGVRPA